MKITGIIPARYASTRFPGKPLTDIGGKSMIQRVYEQAGKASALSDVLVATDDERILQHVRSFGGNAVMTSQDHQSGTDRCFEAITTLANVADVVVNIQGDEPFIQPAQIDLVASCFTDSAVKIATLVKKIKDSSELFNTNIPKVLRDHFQNAIYFSRHPVPYIRGREEKDWLASHTFFKHIGIYAYRVSTLAEICALPQSGLELAESLEQLRWIENGYKIKTELTDSESIAVDTPEDLKKLQKFL